MSYQSSEFVVIGAGPYGLAAASHLRAAGAEVRVFGKVMEFWDSQMPKGMLLRSPWSGSHIGGPNRTLTLEQYESNTGRKINRHIPREDFVRYGQWFQQQTLPDLDSRNVVRVERAANGYEITFEDGESVSSNNVVVATGIASFANIPAVFANLPAELAAHACHRINRDFKRYAGKRVAVVGAGQSAIESAALLQEAGASVDLLVRQSQVHFINLRPVIDSLLNSPLNPLRAPGKVGPAGVDWLVEHPALFSLFPREWQDAMTYRAMRPRGSAWLRPRIDHVKIALNRHAVRADANGGGVRLTFNDGGQDDFDYVLLGTGYKIDIARYSFLSAAILQHVVRNGGYPVLNRRFESSLKGLYFIGATAGYSFGPYVRFVAGTQYAAESLTSGIKQMTLSRNAGNQRKPLVGSNQVDKQKVDAA